MPSVFILLEGNDDERFVSRVIVPLLERQNYTVRIWKYAREKRKRTIQLLKSIQASGMEYVFLRDIDEAISIRVKKDEMVHCFEVLKEGDIVVVIMEIESWYLAGANTRLLRKIGVERGEEFTTDSVTKEQFNRLIPQHMSRIVFMQDLLRHYNIESAMQKNRSFRYFIQRF
ncbi:MAG TPA: hypothetical protein VE134_06720, partial [Methanomicrobiales archaeon]|nr:hypothetical protein [Methanomicrobiales archaeon]